jgi:hypothetical protein
MFEATIGKLTVPISRRKSLRVARRLRAREKKQLKSPPENSIFARIVENRVSHARFDRCDARRCLETSIRLVDPPGDRSRNKTSNHWRVSMAARKGGRKGAKKAARKGAARKSAARKGAARKGGRKAAKKAGRKTARRGRRR